ncbi:MAG TPA: alpha/beta hydrolase [Clostridia bacterium]|nr:alpha/beta hydrolase [Clostridia bacterium]
MKTIVFLHGWGCDKNIWAKQIEYFSKRYICHAWDFSGFGEKTLSKKMTVFDYAEETAENIKSVTNERVVVVGHSFGGRIAIILNSIYPELIEKVVLVSSAGLKSRSLKNKLKTYIYKCKKLLVKAKLLKQDAIANVGGKDYLETSGIKRETFLSVINTDLANHARAAKNPVLLIWGENDKETPLLQGKKLEKFTKGGLCVMSGCGHFCFLEKSDQFNRIIESFLQN